MGWFSKLKKDSPKLTNPKGRVQCNEAASITIHNEKIEGRLKELSWIGFTIDHVEEKWIDPLLDNKGQPYQAEFTLPREFGQMEVETLLVTITRYKDIIEGGSKLQIVFDLEEQASIERIRDFITYRNRRFNRHHSLRKSTRMFKSELIMIWMFLISIGLLAITGILMLFRK